MFTSLASSKRKIRIAITIMADDQDDSDRGLMASSSRLTDVSEQ